MRATVVLAGTVIVLSTGVASGRVAVICGTSGIRSIERPGTASRQPERSGRLATRAVSTTRSTSSRYLPARERAFKPFSAWNETTAAGDMVAATGFEPVTLSFEG